MHLGPPIRPPAEPKPDDLLYRLFFFDGSNHITTSHDFFAATDEEAIQYARQLVDGYYVEVWDRDRFAFRLECP